MTAPVPASARLTPGSPESGPRLLVLAGEWRLGQSRPPVGAVLDPLPSQPPGVVSAIAEDLDSWDSSLLVFLRELEAELSGRGWTLDLSRLPPGVSRLMNLASTVQAPRGKIPADTGEYGVLRWIGLTTLSARASFGNTLRFVGEVVLSLFRLLRGKAQYRPVELAGAVQQASIEALGIVTLVCFLLGLILAFVGAIQLQAFGAAIYVADLVGIAMVRDMGALMTAIVMAGRSGAAYAAQLGTMRVNEEIDALTTMGISPIDFLVLPRIVALVLMMPLLTLYADLVGVLGGLAVGMSMLDLGFAEYLQQTRDAIQNKHLIGGLAKGAVYGALIALAGTLRGMESGKSAGAVGQAATSAVVTAVVWIIAASGLFAYVFYLFGW